MSISMHVSALFRKLQQYMCCTMCPHTFQHTISCFYAFCVHLRRQWVLSLRPFDCTVVYTLRKQMNAYSICDFQCRDFTSTHVTHTTCNYYDTYIYIYDIIYIYIYIYIYIAIYLFIFVYIYLFIGTRHLRLASEAWMRNQHKVRCCEVDNEFPESGLP